MTGREAYLNLELHGRKLFHVDAELAFLLQATTLDVEGRALRLPFPVFGIVLIDSGSLELAEASALAEGGHAHRW